MKNTKWKYSPHYKDDAQGHFFIENEEKIFVINLTGSASMSQEKLNEIAEFVVKIINRNNNPDDKK